MCPNTKLNSLTAWHTDGESNPRPWPRGRSKLHFWWRSRQAEHPQATQNIFDSGLPSKNLTVCKFSMALYEQCRREIRENFGDGADREHSMYSIGINIVEMCHSHRHRRDHRYHF